MWGGLNLFGRQANERQQQIAALQKRVPSAHVAAEDGSLIDVRFAEGASGKAMRMRVFLPPRFPMDKPVLQLMQHTRHPCVDKYNQVSVPYLTEWTSSSSLGELVAYVLELLESGEGEAEALEEAVEEKEEEEVLETMAVPLPEIPGSFGEVESMTEDEARALLEDDLAFADFFDTIKAVQGMRDLRDSLRASNIKLAKDILADRDGFETARAQALVARTQLTQALDDYQANQRRAVAKLPSDVRAAAVDHHREKADLADTKSDDICDRFKANTLDLAEWHRAYRDARLDYHTNAALAHVFVPPRHHR